MVFESVVSLGEQGRYRRYEVRLLCRRCPPSLDNLAQNKETKLCKVCAGVWRRINKKRALKVLDLLSVDEFIRSHPSSFIAKYCRRCPSSFRRKTKAHGLCHACATRFCAYRKKFREDNPLNSVEPTVDEFLKEHPSKYCQTKVIS